MPEDESTGVVSRFGVAFLLLLAVLPQSSIIAGRRIKMRRTLTSNSFRSIESSTTFTSTLSLTFPVRAAGPPRAFHSSDH